jgi:hypothetical protein
VEVLARERIGSYDTVTFAADEANAAVDWLNDNGFIINETMSPYMQPYLDEGMVFIASKLVPGANVDEIRPLRMTYEADRPSIPLRLTAIAAEPHMMVTAFIYAQEGYAPAYVPLATVPAKHLVAGERSNYPMLLSRAVDQEGGNAFIEEYHDRSPVYAEGTGCCGDDDWCGVGGDGLCQCPGSDFDLGDCAEQEELVEAVTMLNDLASEYGTLTRLSSRISPEEMTFNPEFKPGSTNTRRRLELRGSSVSLAACEDQVIDQEAYREASLVAECATTYCDLGECVVTELGVGCMCDDGAAARRFTDSDGLPSLTCVPDVGTVDFSAGGLDVPDACKGADIDGGSCIDVGGFAAVACDKGKSASLVDGGSLPQCADVIYAAGDNGARDYSDRLLELEVCAPPPPSCEAGGWLVEREVEIEGVQCGDPPHESWFEEPPEPDCSAYTSDEQLAEAERASSEDAKTTSERPVLETPPSGKTRQFCNVSHIGGPGAALLSSGLLFAAGFLVARRRRR